MINQQILDYIKQQIQQGVSREQIKSSLIANGWQAQDIEEGFNNIDALNTPTAYSVAPVAASSGLWKIIAGVVIGVAVLGGSAYLANQTPTETPSESLIPQQPSEQPTPQTQPQNPEIVFADKLSSCAKYKATLKHPLTGDMLEKEILGVVGDKCNYIEQMPNGGKMECKYSESESMVVAQYYKDVANAESVGTSFSADLGREEQKATYTINGKVVDNPLQEVMTSGACVISGY
jgi:hypothetical protein